MSRAASVADDASITSAPQFGAHKPVHTGWQPPPASLQGAPPPRQQANTQWRNNRVANREEEEDNLELVRVPTYKYIADDVYFSKTDT